MRLPKLFLASAAMLAVALTTVPAMAEALVDVPFNFTVNGKFCPAGRYQIGQDVTRSLVTLQTMSGSRNFSWVAGPGDPSPYDSRVVLRFDERNGGHELQSVQFGSSITRRLDREPRPNEYVPTQDIQGQ
ncbi:MAG TPA: hypothetical protein VHU89_17885 [Acidobacteriaceae bacterium]|jgi:hypothetical protein|nr:hypothetical protein [Acidobacteriaceae bacterium]